MVLMASPFVHVPVLLDEIVDLARSFPAGAVADLTLGGAGHGSAILKAAPQLSLHGFDRDETAVRVAKERLEPFGERAHVHHERFDSAPAILDELGATPLSGFLMDLGVSSPQLDWADRGFSFRLEGPLDMRMDARGNTTAATIVNDYPRGELIDVLRSYGDERHAPRIVDEIIAARPVTTTTELADIVLSAVPAAVRRKSNTHPATKTFQALRIEVNDELTVLGSALDELIARLAVGGTGLVLTYHSGEDRIVKDRMRQAIEGSAPAGLSVSTGFRWEFRGARKPTDSETEANPRSRSARLRAITRGA